MATGSYSTLGFIIDVYDNSGNHANSGRVDDVEISTYVVHIARTDGTTQDTPDQVYIRGPKDGDLITARKISTGNYEVTLKNRALYTEYRVDIRPYAVNGNHTITYYNGDTPSTAAATYSSSVAITNIRKFEAIETSTTYAKGPIEFPTGNLQTYDPTGSPGADTSNITAIAIASGHQIGGHHNGYLRTLMEWTNGADINIGQTATTLIGGINLQPGSNGVAKVNGNKIFHVGNDGSGSGLDADTVDGTHLSNLMTLSGTQTITGDKDFDGFDL